MMIRSIASLAIVAASVQFSFAAVIELYRVPGALLDAADGRFAVRTTTRSQYNWPTGAAVTVRDVTTGKEVLHATSQQILNSLPMQTDAKSVSFLHYGFGQSAAIVGNRILVGSPGGTDYCDCAVDPPVDVLGRAGHAFVFEFDGNMTPLKLDAPELSTLMRENLNSAADNWLYFGWKVAAAGTTGLVNGSTFDLSTGKMLVRLSGSDPAFDSIAVNSSKAFIGHAWRSEVSIYDFLGGELRTLTVPFTGDRNGHPISVEANLALLGVPGPQYGAEIPGSAFLFDIETGEELMSFNASHLGVVDSLGGDGFGSAVAIRGDFALIGAPHDSQLTNRSGAAYLFNIRTGELVQKILPTNLEYPLNFGRSVSLTNGFALIEDLNFAGREQVPMTSIYAIPEPATIFIAILAAALQWRPTRRST